MDKNKDLFEIARAESMCLNYDKAKNEEDTLCYFGPI
jgi:hypothetical protein